MTSIPSLLSTFFLLVVFFFSSIVYGSPLRIRHQNRHTVDTIPFDSDLPERSTQADTAGGTYFFSVLGVPATGSSTVAPRLEIRQLEKDADQFNVYLLGLNRFMQMNETDKLSYYQISGIHGRPFIPWDGVGESDNGGGGYCTHSSNLFPTWHRPYLALYEEVFYLCARQAIAEFSAGDTKDRYKAALLTLRTPYWDWAMLPPEGEDTMPSSLQNPFIDVVMPNGTNTIPNPLYSYTFHPLINDDLYDSTVPQFSIWPSTLRAPSTQDASATSRNDLVATQMNGLRANLQSRLYQVFTMTTGYLNMSNDWTSGDSLEAVHDTVHNTLGSGGHMTDIPFSAFDPIFWLHHAMVDRCFALWQALYPDQYVVPMSQYYTTFSIPSGTVEDIDSPLFPFHKNDQGDFWTSDEVRSTDTFGYTYPELVGLGNDTSALMAMINNLYGSNASSGGLTRQRSLDRRVVAGAPSFAAGRQYNANVKVQKFALNGSFSVYIMLGDVVSSDPSAWTSDPSFVGVSGSFASANAPASKANGISNGAVPLTAALEAKLQAGEIECLDEDVVGQYLHENLSWRVKSANNDTEIPVESVPGLQVAVLWSEVQPATSNAAFPKMMGDFQVLTEATSGKCGGFQPGDRLGSEADIRL